MIKWLRELLVNGNMEYGKASRIQISRLLVRHAMNSGERISPVPVSSSLYTSITEVLSRRRIRHNPSLVIVCLSPSDGQYLSGGIDAGGDAQSRKAAVKLIHKFPSQVPLPLRLTIPGILLVSNSSSLSKIPFLLRNPIIILGTPSRKDCIQNFRSFLSYLNMSLSLSIKAEVLSSTQLIGSSLLSGLQSHTIQQ